MTRIIKDGLHYPIEAFRSFHPEVHGTPSQAVLARYGWQILQYDPEPETAPDQMAERGSVEYRDDVPYWTWTVRDKLPEEYAIQTAEQARKEIVRWIDGMSSQVLDLYPRAVQARWMIEEAAARAVLNGTDTDAQLELITREGAAKGRTPGEHAQAVVKNADRFRAITDQINTLFLATDTALAQATHPAQYLAIMARAKEQALPLAEAYGLKV